MGLPFLQQSIGFGVANDQPNRHTKTLRWAGQILFPHLINRHALIHHDDIVGQNGLALAHVGLFGRDFGQHIGDGIDIRMHMQRLGHLIIALQHIVHTERQTRLRQPVAQQHGQQRMTGVRFHNQGVAAQQGHHNLTDHRF